MISAAQYRNNHKTAELDVEDLFSDPNMFLLGVDLEKRTAIFLPLTRTGYREISFLDDRAIRHDARCLQLDLDDLFELCSDRSDLLKSPQYIFHTGFSCSTLLARCLDAIEGCFLIKEPFILHQISEYRLQFQKGNRAFREWKHLLGLATRFLSRTFLPSDRVLIKADCNFILDSLLESNKGASVLFWYPALSTFVLSILKEEPRREWVRTRLERSALIHRSQGDRFSFAEYIGRRAHQLTDTQAAACFWLSQICIYHESLRRFRQCRIKILRSDQFIDNTSDTLLALARHFDLKASEADVKRIIQSDVMQYHAKNLLRRFNFGSFSAELRTLAETYRDELANGIHFIETVVSDLEIAQTIGGEIDCPSPFLKTG